LSRQERKALKKKQGAEKAKQSIEEDSEEEDDLLVNPNRAAKKMNISTLEEPRELTRRERSASFCTTDVSGLQFCLEKLKRRKKHKSGTGR
jgi:hypothetical protein